MTTYSVQVPLAGYMTFEIEFDGEASTSTGWSGATEFEEAVLNAAFEKFEALFTVGPNCLKAGVDEWDVNPLRRIVAGNVFLGEANEIDFEEVE